MLINMRNAMMAGGGRRFSAKDYVQDGLVAMWDGIENVGWGVHDPNATVWVDLMGGEGFTLRTGNATWGDNCLICNIQPNSTAQGSTSRSVNQIQGEYVFRNDRAGDTGTYHECAIVTDGTSHKNLYGQFYASSTHIYFSEIKPRVYIKSSPALLGVATSISVTYPPNSANFGDLSKWAAYGDGEIREVAKDTSNTAKIRTHDHLRINGGRSAGQGSFVGAMFCIRLYSRALTAEEIAANYAVDKVRFNLPDAT